LLFLHIIRIKKDKDNVNKRTDEEKKVKNKNYWSLINDS